MFRLTISIDYLCRDFLYTDGEMEEMILVIKSLAEHEDKVAGNRNLSFEFAYEPDKTVTIAKGTNGEEIVLADE